MIMLITASEDGISVQFFDSHDNLMRDLTDDGDHPALITRWLTASEAREDPNYWPEDSAFLAQVAPMKLEPEDIVTTWRAVPQ